MAMPLHAPDPRPDLWNIQRVRELPESGNRYEIVDGELLVTRAPSLTHQRAIVELLLRLQPYLLEKKAGEALCAPADVEISDWSMVEPDVFVIPQRAGRLPHAWKRADQLLLAVEVISESSARADRGTKRRLYLRERVAEYWIIDTDSRLIERWTAGHDRPAVETNALSWAPAGVSDPFEMDLRRFFSRVHGEL